MENEISFQHIFQNHDIRVVEEEGEDGFTAPNSAIQSHMRKYDAFDGMNGFARMQACRKALTALDRRGWERSYHQKYTFFFMYHHLLDCAL